MNKWYMHNPESILEMGFWRTNRSPNLGQTTRSYNKQKKKERKLAELWTLQSRRTTEWDWKNVKREISTSILLAIWKKLSNMKVTIIPIVIGALRTITKGLVLGLKNLEITERVETIQTAAFLRSAGILRRVLETWGDFLLLKLQWETISWC